MNSIDLFGASISDLKLQSASIEELTKKYPYFAIGHILNAKIAFQSNEIKFQERLNIAALYANSRTGLFEFIYQSEYFYVPKPIKVQEEIINQISDTEASKLEVGIVDTSNDVVNTENIATVPISHTEVIDSKPELQKLTDVVTEAALLNVIEAAPTVQIPAKEPAEDKKDDLRERVLERLGVKTAENKDVVEKSPIVEAKPKRKAATKKEKAEAIVDSDINLEAKPKTPKAAKKAKVEIIENFIKINPSINRPTDQDYSETVELANKSLDENLDFVSETLAEIYLKQGNKEKAIKIFQQLSLKYPEKKRYFAAQIKKIE